ncbi:MAG TPA: GNAT family protein [Gemmatimonadales bacterium]|nr:GNAT family protein [Gemmatimonadales bacterium]
MVPPIDPRPVTLEGRHVRLEPLSLAHHDRLCAVGLDAELWRWGLSTLATPADMRAYIETALAWQAQGTAVPFAIVARATGQVVGSTRYANIERADRRLEIGWTWLARAAQRTPANTEAKYLLLRHAFEVLGCIRVEFKTDVLNEPSRAALLRIGAKQEGILLSHMVTASGRIRDSMYFSIVAGEWPAVKAGLEQKLARPG